MEENGLFPVYEVPDFIEDNEITEQSYKKSVLWDFEKGDFALSGTNRMVEAGEEDSYIQWCCKAISTERYEHLSYPDAYGAEMEDAMEQPSNDAVESCLERTITEALMTHPCTEYVRDFEFVWEGDRVYCSLIVKGVDLEEKQMNTYIGGDIDGIRISCT